MIRVYMMPATDQQITARGQVITVRRPKYAGTLDVTNLQYQLFPNRDWCICAIDTDLASHDAIKANNDARQLPPPENLDNAIGANGVTTVEQALALAGLPDHWVDAGDTWREVAEIMWGLALFAQRFEGIRNAPITADTWDMRWNQLGTAVKQALQDAAESFKTQLDTSFVTQTTTLGVIFFELAKQYMLQRDKPIKVFGYELFSAKR